MATINEILKEEQFTFSKKWGQNFITDNNLLAAIVNDAEITSDDNVLEIGAGAGTLTRNIALKCRKLVSYEIDNSLRPVLARTLEGLTNVEMVYADIMKQPLNEVADKFDGGSFKIVANLPYYITTPIIFHFLESNLDIKSLTIMVQKEVAERICARHDTAEYGAITASVAIRGNAKITRIVSRNMFNPAPNVDSAIVKIDLCNKYDLVDFSETSKLITAAFAMRRKTLVNNLMASYGMPRATAEDKLREVGLNILARGETLTTEQFVALGKVLGCSKTL